MVDVIEVHHRALLVMVGLNIHHGAMLVVDVTKIHHRDLLVIVGPNIHPWGYASGEWSFPKNGTRNVF